jgi:zeaxanthin epoxidase
MMPNLGQGGCQAIEDAWVLSEMLCGVTDKSQIPDALQQYYRQRIVRSAIVQGMSRFSSDIIISAFSTPFKFDEFLKEGFSYKYLTFPSLMTNILQVVLPYIFYMQFGYLYSFSPSTFSEEQIGDLVSTSLTRNKAEASKVYENLSEGFTTYFTAKTMSLMRFNKKTKEMTKIADAEDLRKQAALSIK